MNTRSFKNIGSKSENLGIGFACDSDSRVRHLGAANPKFLNLSSLFSSVNNYISICIISLFVTFVMITGGIDIQASSIVGLTSIIVGASPGTIWLQHLGQRFNRNRGSGVAVRFQAFSWPTVAFSRWSSRSAAVSCIQASRC